MKPMLCEKPGRIDLCPGCGQPPHHDQCANPKCWAFGFPIAGVPMLVDDRWIIEPKMNGQRIVIDCSGSAGGARAYNRRGERTDVPLLLRPSLDQLENISVILDGEFVGDCYFVFDVMKLDEVVTTQTGWKMRRHALAMLFAQWEPAHARIVPAGQTTTAKKRMARKIHDSGMEGWVAKRSDSTYQAGKRSVAWRKVKLTKDADFVAIALGTDGKANIELGLYDGDTLVPVGTVSALTGDGPQVQVGNVITVTFLNSGTADAPRLYQPVKPRLRTDKTPQECTMDQLEGTEKAPI